MTPTGKRIIYIALGTALVLLIPLVLTIRDGAVEGVGWNWSPGDFLFAGVLIFVTGLAYELVSRKGSTHAYRAAVCMALSTSFLLVWINAAVGIIGQGPINLLYFAVIAYMIIGALQARFTPQGMMRTLIITAIAQLCVPIIALIMWHPDFSPGIFKVFVLNAVFAILYIVSALLFRRARSAAN